VIKEGIVGDAQATYTKKEVIIVNTLL